MDPLKPCDGVFVTAARCADCEHKECINSCPEGVDLKALFEFVAAQSPLPLAWKQNAAQAEAFADEAIQKSFN